MTRRRVPQVDLVHHGGASTAGEYAHTPQMVDVATGWSERVAVLGRSQRAMEAGFRRILGRLPFPVVELHPDNGSEFFNDHLLRFWGAAISGLTLSRSRPYHKNDNRLVEQKNDTLVRASVGYGRLDTPTQVAALDALYEQLWVYDSRFQPVLHLLEKGVVAGKVQRKWDVATLSRVSRRRACWMTTGGPRSTRATPTRTRANYGARSTTDSNACGCRRTRWPSPPMRDAA